MDVGKVGAAYASSFHGSRPANRTREGWASEKALAAPEEAPIGALSEGVSDSDRKSEVPADSLLSRLVQRHPREVELQVHEATNRVIIRITDAQTGETLTEVPRESYLDMVANFLSRLDRLQGEARGLNLDRVF